MKNILTVPNILSISRIPILFICIYFMKEGKENLVLFFLFIALITDALDGFLARRTRTESNLGRILDHVIDKIFFNTLCFSLYFYKDLPLFFALFLLIRDLTSLILGFILMKKGEVMGSNLTGKIGGAFLSFTLFSYLYSLDIREELLFATLLSLILASLVYFVVFIMFYRRAIKREKQKTGTTKSQVI